MTDGEIADHRGGASAQVPYGASRPLADEYLREQIALARLQADDLRREDRVRHWSLRVHHISELLKLGFELGLAVIIVVAVAALGLALWSAAHENGLVFESFSMPPNYIAQGITGQVMANQVIDRIAAMRATTFDMMSPELGREGSQNDLHIQIPETGISFTELYAAAARRLGHQTPIAGEVYQSAKGVTLAIRVQGAPSHVYSGAALDALVDEAAADLMAETEPGRYGMYLFQAGHLRDALDFFNRTESTVPPEGRADFYAEWAFVLQGAGDFRAVIDRAGTALEADPNALLAVGLIFGSEVVLGHNERALSLAPRVMRAADVDRAVPQLSKATLLAQSHEWIAQQDGDFGAAAAISHSMLAIAVNEFNRSGPSLEAQDLASQHDVEAARRVAVASGFASDAALDPIALYAMLPPLPFYHVDLETGDWQGALREISDAEADAAKPGSPLNGYVATFYAPRLAYARARTGDLAGAVRLIGTTPDDCYPCLRTRAQVAVLSGNRPEAERWFAAAVQAAPSLPLAFADWGAMLLHAGDFPAAIVKLRQASERGPHFADPLEMWGEALMQEDRSDLALPKFQSAAQYAPNWGRLHLKWGEALLYAGHPAEAQTQLVIASTLYLSPRDRLALGRYLR